MTDYPTVPASRVSLCRFLDALAHALEESGRRALWIPRQYAVLWREGETMNIVRPLAWGSETRDAPRLHRIAVNQSDIEVSPRARILLGFGHRVLPGHDERLDLELTVMTVELEPLALWLPSWIAGRVDPEALIPAPPVLCDPWKFDWRTTNYVWSTAAWNAQSDWEEREKAARAQREVRRRMPIEGRAPVAPAVSDPRSSSAANAGPTAPASGAVVGPARPGT
jgi:hypothetical protein